MKEDRGIWKSVHRVIGSKSNNEPAKTQRARMLLLIASCQLLTAHFANGLMMSLNTSGLLSSRTR
jgi:hypothetical protein